MCRSQSAWEKEASPIFEAAGLSLAVTVTTRKNQAYEEVLMLDPQTIDAILCVGGDGTMSEIIQVHSYLGLSLSYYVSLNSENY